MNRALAIIGALLLVIGGVSAVFGQSVIATNGTSDTSHWPSYVSVSADVSNTGLDNGNGYTYTAPYNAYFVYYNSLGQVVLIDKVLWTSAQSSVVDSPSTCQPVNTGQPCGFTPTSVPGAGSTLLGFHVNIFFVDAKGVPMGTSIAQQVTFSVPIHFIVFYGGVGSITVSPPGSGVQQCTSNCPNTGGLAFYEGYWASGTQMTVTTSAGVAPVTWASGINDLCSASSSGSGFVCNFAVSPSYNAFVTSSGSTSNPNAIIVYVNNAGGQTVTPLEICLSPSAWQMSVPQLSCGPSGTFTLSTYASWSVEQQISLKSVLTGAGSTATLTYAELQQYVTFSSGIAGLEFVTSQSSLLQIVDSGVSGATITPAPGNYYCSDTSTVCQPGGTVKVSVTVPSGYQLNDWIENGQNAGTDNPITVTMPASGTVTIGPVIVPSSGGPPPPPPPGGSCTLSPSTNAAAQITVTAPNGSAIIGALVSGQGGSATTDSHGVALVCNIPVPSGFGGNSGIATFTVTASGFKDGTTKLNLVQGQTSSGAVVLQPTAPGLNLGGLAAIIPWVLIPSGVVLLAVGLVLPSRRSGS